MKLQIILLNLLFVILGLQAQSTEKQCELWRQNLEQLEQKLLPRNKQLIIKEERNSYQQTLNDTQKNLDQLRAITSDEQKTIDWYKKELRDMLTSYEDSKIFYEKQLSPKNANNVLKRSKREISNSIRYLQNRLATAQDPKTKQQAQKSLDRYIKLSKLSDKELLDKELQQYQGFLDALNSQIDDINNKLNSKQLSTDAHNKINKKIELDRQAIEDMSNFIARLSEDKLYDDAKNMILSEVNLLKDLLKKCE